MAKKRTRHTPELKLEELRDADRALSAAADENLIDFDPQSELASATAVAAEEVGDTISTLAVSADFLAARDELKARLGGMDAMMAVAVPVYGSSPNASNTSANAVR